MNTIIFGYGKMGRAIESELLSSAMRPTYIVNSAKDIKQNDLADLELDKKTVAFDFTGSANYEQNIEYLAKIGCNIVSGTTGVTDIQHKLQSISKQYNCSILYSSNFAIAVQIFWRLSSQLSRMISPFDDYDIAVHEVHHNQKHDAPSGTAISTAEIILNNIARKKEIAHATNGKIDKAQLQISALRVGSTIGEHSVICDGPDDSIKITHNAKNRKIYARGAIACAKWLMEQRTGFFTMDDYIDDACEQNLLTLIQ